MKKGKKMKPIQLLLVLVGLLTFIVFAIPLSLSVNLNIGNLTGLTVSILLVIYGVFLNQINQLRSDWKKKRYKKLLVYFAEGVAILAVLLVTLLSILMVRFAVNEPMDNETLIVLGCRVYGENPSLSLRERLDAAYEYLCTNPETYCVVSGGQGTGEDISEAECMYRYLTAKGIGENRIFKEEKSSSTRENIAFSMKIIEENNLPDKVAVATSEYHQYRVHLIAKELGVENTAVSGRTAIWLFPTFYVRELYGILYEWLF